MASGRSRPVLCAGILYMRQLVPVLIILAGCHGSPIEAPNSLVRTAYFLSSIDGKALPATVIGWPPDQRIERASMAFDLFRPLRDRDEGIVSYGMIVSGRTDTNDHRYRVIGGVLHIDLCPVGSRCPGAVYELVGPLDPDRLMLTYSTGGMASSVLRFHLLLPD